MRTITIFASLAVLVATAGVAEAEGTGRFCMAKAGNDYRTVDALLTTMIDHGYRIRGLETKEGWGKLHAIDRNGAEAVLFVDLASGADVDETIRRND
ncbi:PepSY domain-containing protein [Rhodoblastus sp.]|uniref:PepSY domain-containing protein n=1 Tax=Rhodoblastus sp. TaxID=1962975 RepID=UPI0035B4322A